MRVRGGVVAFAIGFLISLRADADTVWAPLMGHIVGGGAGRPWFSETRVINPNLQPATVTVTDTVGIGDPPHRTFTIPPKGILNLRNYELFFTETPPPAVFPPLLALVEFTSDVPIQVLTEINTASAQSAGPGIPCEPNPHFGGDCFRPLAGPLLRGFREYFAPGDQARLDWLTSSFAYRNNLFLTNPTTETLVVSATFRSANGDVLLERIWEVPPRSQLFVQDVLRGRELYAASP
jgi:hypothetical protein